MNSRFWNDERWARAEEALRQSRTVLEAAQRLGVTVDALASTIRRKGKRPGDYFGNAKPFLDVDIPLPEEIRSEPEPQAQQGSLVESLVNAIRKAPVAFVKLCDDLDLRPSQLRGLIGAARGKGIDVHVEHDHVALRAERQTEIVREFTIAPIVGEIQSIGVLSDIHFGSKYIRRDALIDCVNAMYEQGIREIVHPGDFLDGVYRFSMFEQSHVGMEAQTKDAFETLPQKPGLSYRCVLHQDAGTLGGTEVLHARAQNGATVQGSSLPRPVLPRRAGNPMRGERRQPAEVSAGPEMRVLLIASLVMLGLVWLRWLTS